MAFMDLLKKATKPAAAPSGPTPAERERKLQAQLMCIDLLNPVNRLSPEKIRELNIDGVIRYASQTLKYPESAAPYLDTLDKHITFLIQALEQSVKAGLEMTAEWSCTALVFAVRNLSIEAGGTEKEYEDKIWEARLQYLQNLELLVRCCIEHDRQSETVTEMTERLRRRHEELEQRKQHFLTRKQSGELDAAIAELQMHAHHPAMLSPDAMKLREDLGCIADLSKDVEEIDRILASRQNALEQISAEIQFLRNILSAPPTV